MASDKKVLPGLCGVCFNAESTPRIDPNFSWRSKLDEISVKNVLAWVCL